MSKRKKFSFNNRIDVIFRELRYKNEKPLICYVVAGYPNMKASEQVIVSLIEGGADMIEIGIPFSDPIADGSTIQEAIHESLNAGTTPDQCLELALKIRNRYPHVPLIVMTYSNILYKIGYMKFVQNARAKGIDGFILPDIPVEESKEYVQAARKNNMVSIFLVAPNTTKTRLRLISKVCTGFLYVVSVLGITGERIKFDQYTFDFIKNVRKTIKNQLPIAAGFGISNPDHVRNMIESGADAVIIGSAIIRKIKETNDNKMLPKIITQFIAEMKKPCIGK